MNPFCGCGAEALLPVAFSFVLFSLKNQSEHTYYIKLHPRRSTKIIDKNYRQKLNKMS